MLRHRTALAMIVALLACGRIAATPVFDVYPTGTVPLDADNVQAAVDRGGIVRLKAVDFARRPTAFNFGGHSSVIGSVLLRHNVVIFGEETAGARTTIRGGTWPFFGNVAVKATIAGIDFESPWGGAILIIRSRGATIAGNRIANVIPYMLPVNFTQGDGIDVNGDSPSAITGEVRIIDNEIEGLTADFAVGMQLDGDNADVVIRGNTVHVGQDLDAGSIESDGILVLRNHRSVEISGNTVIVGPGTVFDGIAIAGDSDARYRVTGNTVESESPQADGILAIGGRFSEPTVAPLIENNTVTMHGSLYGGIGLYGAVSDGLIADNRISGDAAVALQATDDGQPADLATGNAFTRNALEDLAAAQADILFGANSSGNVESGACRSFIDEGIGNRLDCGSPSGTATR